MLETRVFVLEPQVIKDNAECCVR